MSDGTEPTDCVIFSTVEWDFCIEIVTMRSKIGSDSGEWGRRALCMRYLVCSLRLNGVWRSLC